METLGRRRLLRLVVGRDVGVALDPFVDPRVLGRDVGVVLDVLRLRHPLRLVVGRDVGVVLDPFVDPRVLAPDVGVVLEILHHGRLLHVVIVHHVMDDAAGNALAHARLRLVVDPIVILSLERLRETGESGGSEQVREPVAARELGVHLPIDERDVEGVVVDLYLAVLGRGPLRG